VAGGHVFHAQVAAVAAGESASTSSPNSMPIRRCPLLGDGVYKFDHMEWAIEKATELGVAAIAPVIARRTEKHLAAAAGKRAERWRRIVHEAAQQARRSDVPIIFDPAPLAVRVRAASEATRADSGTTCIVLAEQERTTTLRYALEEAVTAAGTETPRLEIAIVPRADGRLRKRRSSTPMAGAPHRSARASCAPKPRPSPRSPWWLRTSSNF